MIKIYVENKREAIYGGAFVVCWFAHMGTVAFLLWICSKLIRRRWAADSFVSIVNELISPNNTRFVVFSHVAWKIPYPLMGKLSNPSGLPSRGVLKKLFSHIGTPSVQKPSVSVAGLIDIFHVVYISRTTI